MKIEHAIEIVLDLASHNTYDEKIETDPILLEEGKKQREAIDTVSDFFTNNVFN